MRSVQITMRTLLLESILKPLAGEDDALASYGMESFAHMLARQLEGP